MQDEAKSQFPCSLTRRTALHVMAGGAVAGMVSQLSPAAHAAADPPLIIDTHAHIYADDDKRYPTMDNPYRPPAGTGTIEHLKREVREAGVRQLAAIQTASYYRFDNRFLADSSAAHRDLMIGVCTLDPDDPGSPAILEKYVRTSNVRGVRSIPAKSGLLDDPGVERLWAAAEMLGVPVNVLVNRDKRPELENMAGGHPKLRVVIDHCLNLKAGAEMEPILTDMLALARLPNAYAKLSFVPSGSAEEYPCRDMHAPCLEIIK